MNKNIFKFNNIKFKFFFINFDKNKLEIDINKITTFFKIQQFYFCFNKNIKIIYMPKKIKKYTFIKSPFVFKESREQYIFSTFKVYILLNLKKNSYDFFIYNFLKNYKNFKLYSKSYLYLKKKY